MIGCRWAVPLFIYTLAFALQLRKSTENLNQVRTDCSYTKHHYTVTRDICDADAELHTFLTSAPDGADKSDGLQIWRVAANILNKQSWSASKGWSSRISTE
jgi:hypothetical protein